jgi:hypothetical protein
MAEPGQTMTETAFSLRKNDLVTLLLGPQEEQFAVHESCVARNSDFFRAAVKKEWIEGQTRTIKLPEETCIESFVNYLNFACHGRLPTVGIETRPESPDKTFTDDPYGELGRIYVIGERMLDKTVQNAVAREFVRLAELRSPDKKCELPGPKCVDIIYTGTSNGSPMRRMMVDFYVTQGAINWPYHGQHPEFLGDLAQQLQTKIMGQIAVRDFRFRKLVAEEYFV